MSEPTRILLPHQPGGFPEPVQTLSDYLARGGFQALGKALAMPPQAIIDEVKRSGLRGRGGAGFPTGIKWEVVAKNQARAYQTLSPYVGSGSGWDRVYAETADLYHRQAVKFLCCNLAEGEPGTYKDRYLIHKNPYQLLEGMAIAAYAIGVAQSYIGIKEIFVEQIPRLRVALEECTTQGYLGLKAMGSGVNILIAIAIGPDSYLFGEDRAMLEVIEGKPPWPRLKGVLPVDYGLFGHPTVVNNAETLSLIPHIMNRGADWFRSIGTKDTPGTMCFTLSGDVRRPGVYELPMGTLLRTLIEEYGDGTVNGRVKAVFSGPTNAVIPASKLDTPLDIGSMRRIPSGLGSGGYIVYDETACIVKAGLNFSRFLAYESCGQCPSCKTGTARITERLERLEVGTATEEDVLTIAQETMTIRGQGHCFLVTEEGVNIGSILHVFPDEVVSHIGRGCWSDRPLLLPKIKAYDEATHTFTYDVAYYDRMKAQGAALWQTR